MNTPVVEAVGLTRRFGHFTAVDHIDVHVARGEVFGLLGANGAGKTTAIRMLCGLLPVSAGRITVAGVDTVRHPRRARARLGYVAQGFALYAELSVEENLALQAGLYGLSPRAARARVNEVMGHLELSPLRERASGALPLGFQRRLSLAAALLHRPEVLFLDEPTSGVDPAARQHFWELIYDLADEGIGILVTTHYMDETAFCDRLSLMHAGRIVAEGTPEQLLARPLATPMVELAGRDVRALAPHLSGHPAVRDAIPHAGRLRVRLAAGTTPAAALDQLTRLAKDRGLHVDAANPVRPDLEDLFVAVLEEAGGG
ncbi:MAG: ABC transporter ATP-binding protein [Thiohalomonadaceae bacterium]